MFPGMSTHRKDNKWVVRWREDGTNRSLSFDTKREALAFDREIHGARRQERQVRAVRDALARVKRS